MFFVQYLQLCFLILRMLISFKVACIIVLTNIQKMYPLWIHTFFKSYILEPKIVGAWQGSTLSRDTWNFFQHKFASLKT